MSDHLGENAALYALGMLDEVEAGAVLDHATRCDACSRLLAQAEEDVTAIASEQAQLEPPADLGVRIAHSTALQGAVPPARRSWRAPALAFAAALVIAILPTGYLVTENQRMHQSTMYADAVERIIESPHKQVAFSGSSGMVMYAPDGSWYCVFVKGAQALHVAWMHDGKMTMLGTMVRHGNVALLYLPNSHRMDQLAIMSDDEVVGRANLTFD